MLFSPTRKTKSEHIFYLDNPNYYIYIPFNYDAHMDKKCRFESLGIVDDIL